MYIFKREKYTSIRKTKLHLISGSRYESRASCGIILCRIVQSTVQQLGSCPSNITHTSLPLITVTSKKTPLQTAKSPQGGDSNLCGEAMTSQTFDHWHNLNKCGGHRYQIVISFIFYFEDTVALIHYQRMNGTVNLGFTICVADFMHPCGFYHVAS